MTYKEKYLIYQQMFEEAQELEKKIRAALELLGLTVYCVYIAVGKEEEKQFFTDIEYGGSPEKYRRYRGLYTKEQLTKRFLEVG